MKHLAALSLLALFVPSLHAGGTRKEARQLWLRGSYAEAQEIYADLAKAGKDRVPAVIGLSKAHQSQGQYDKALAVIDAALKDLPKTPELLARRAELLYLNGQWADAQKTAQAAIEVND